MTQRKIKVIVNGSLGMVATLSKKADIPDNLSTFWHLLRVFWKSTEIEKIEAINIKMLFYDQRNSPRPFLSLDIKFLTSQWHH